MDFHEETEDLLVREDFLDIPHHLSHHLDQWYLEMGPILGLQGLRFPRRHLALLDSRHRMQCLDSLGRDLRHLASLEDLYQGQEVPTSMAKGLMGRRGSGLIR